MSRFALVLAALLLSGCTAQPAPPTATTAPNVLPTPANVATSDSGFVEMVPADTGPAEHANGTVALDGDGVPASYLAAADDDWNLVAARLSLAPSYMWQLNCLRRSSVILNAGDTVNLDPVRAATVGDENGVVLDVPSGGACRSNLPPQV